MEKVLLYAVGAIIYLAYSYYKHQQKQKAVAEQKAAQLPTLDNQPTASRARSFDEMLKQIRDAQANETVTFPPEVQPEAVGPDIWQKSTPAKPSHLEPEKYKPAYKAHSQQLASGNKQPKSAEQGKAVRPQAEAPVEKKKQPQNTIGAQLKQKGELRKAFIYQVIFERKF